MCDCIDVLDKRLFLSKFMTVHYKAYWSLPGPPLGVLFVALLASTRSTLLQSSVFDIDMPVSIWNMRSTTHKLLVASGYRKPLCNSLFTDRYLREIQFKDIWISLSLAIISLSGDT